MELACEFTSPFLGLARARFMVMSWEAVNRIYNNKDFLQESQFLLPVQNILGLAPDLKLNIVFIVKRSGWTIISVELARLLHTLYLIP